MDIEELRRKVAAHQAATMGAQDIEALRAKVAAHQAGKAPEASPMGDSQQYDQPIGPSPMTRAERDMYASPGAKKAYEFHKNARDIGPLELINLPNQVLQMGADKMAGEQDVLKRFFMEEGHGGDKSYTPGDAAAQSATNNTYGQAAIKTGMDLIDLPTLLGLLGGGSAAGKAARGASGVIGDVEKAGARGLGRVGEVFTGGAISPDGMEAGLKFSIPEQADAVGTFRRVASKFGEARDLGKKPYIDAIEPTLRSISEVGSDGAPAVLEMAARDFAKSAQTPSRAISSSGLDKTATDLGRAIKDLKLSNVPTTGADNLLGRISAAANRGVTYGPELDSILDNVNRLKVTPLDNERAVYSALKNELSGPNSAISGVWDAYKAAAPEMAAGRARTAEAADMAVGRAGGHLTEMYRTGQTLADVRGAVDAFRKGEPAGVLKGLTMILAHHPGAWNKLAAALRIPPEAAMHSLDKVAGFIASNPRISNMAAAALAAYADNETTPVGDMAGALNANMEDASLPEANPAGPGPSPQSAPQMQPQGMPNPAQGNMPPSQIQAPNMQAPLPPPISPQDAMLMQQTGLQSIQNGKIMDPMEREKFTNDVMANDALSPEQKAKIRLHLNKTGGGVLTPDML